MKEITKGGPREREAEILRFSAFKHCLLLFHCWSLLRGAGLVCRTGLRRNLNESLDGWMGAWMAGWEREGVEQEADGKGRQETGEGKEGGQEGMQSRALEGACPSGMLALLHSVRPSWGVSVPGARAARLQSSGEGPLRSLPMFQKQPM